jgi:hypothetical protein
MGAYSVSGGAAGSFDPALFPVLAGKSAATNAAILAAA